MSQLFASSWCNTQKVQLPECTATKLLLTPHLWWMHHPQSLASLTISSHLPLVLSSGFWDFPSLPECGKMVDWGQAEMRDKTLGNSQRSTRRVKNTFSIFQLVWAWVCSQGYRPSSSLCFRGHPICEPILGVLWVKAWWVILSPAPYAL